MPLHDVEGAVTNRNGETVRLLFSTAVFVEPGQAVSGGVESIRDLGVLRQLLAQAPGEDPETGLVAFDPRMAQIMALVQRIKDTDSTILITGESGTGKSLLAKEIHRLSPRRNRPFIKISCAALAETLLESELFAKTVAELSAQAPSPVRCRTNRGNSRRPMAASCFWTRSGMCPRPRRSSCSASCRSRSSSGWGPTGPSG